MRIEIEIPEEFEVDYTADKFADFLGRVKADIDYNGMCGNYERETADVLAKAFKHSRVIQPVAYKGGQLIDADAYRDDFMQDVYEVLSNESDNIKANLIIDAFDRIPTTYDVGAVVEQLEKKIQEHERASEYGDITEEYKHLKAVEALKDAIEIVKGGVQMTRIELCKMCNEYSTDTRCEFGETCKLQKILTDNAQLRARNKELKAKVEKLESDASWEKFPDMMGK